MQQSWARTKINQGPNTPYTYTKPRWVGNMEGEGKDRSDLVSNILSDSNGI